MSEENPVLEKIRKLLRRTVERGASQAEAESAMAAAQKLMTQHQISEIEVGDPDAQSKMRELKLVEEKFNTNRKRHIIDEFLIPTVLRDCFQVRILVSTKYTEVPKKSGRGVAWVKRHVYWLYGDQSDVEVAKVVIPELYRAAKFAMNRHLRQHGIPWTAVTARSFYEGLMVGYIEANKRGRDEALLEAGEAAAGKYAIVLQDKEAAVNDMVSKVFTVRSKNRGPRSSEFNSSAFSSGHAVGKNMNLAAPRIGHDALKDS